MISSSRSAEPRSNSSSAAEKRGSGCPANAGENQEPASNPSSTDDCSDGSAPVPSVVRSTVLSCRTYGTPSALVATSISTHSAPARAPAAIAASVFSGVIDE